MYITFGSDTSYFNLQRSATRSLQERSLDIGRALKSVNLIQSSVDCRANVEPEADARGAPGAPPPPPPPPPPTPHKLKKI